MPGWGCSTFDDAGTRPDKQLRRASGGLLLEQAPVAGYEIHAGVTSGLPLAHPLVLLDDAMACSALLRWAGLENGAAFDCQARREGHIERLADCLEQSLAIEPIIAV